MEAAAQSSSHPARAAVWLVVLLPALILTLSDAVKPLHMDDTFGLRVAEQISRHPADPYGFDIFWVQWPQPASEELTPPVLPYWWSLGLRLFGERPVLWKLWLFPFAALFSVSWWYLVRRFAPSLAGPLLWMTLLSPAVLPAFNLMQDVPALALGTAGLALFLRAVERGGLGLAGLAGFVAGLATQTKYSAVGFCGAILLWGIVRRRLAPTLVAVAVAALVFVGWEGLMTLRYGQGMLSGQLEEDLYWVSRPAMTLHLVRLVGGTLALPVLLGLPALGVRVPAVLGLGGVVLAAYGLLWFLPLSAALYLGLGFLVLVLLIVLAVTSVRGSPGERPRTRDPEAVFLALWLAGEVLLYFAAAPFPAVRRVSGIVLAATLLVGHRAVPAVLRAGRGWVRGLAAASVALGALHATIDVIEARAQRRAVLQAEVRIGEAGAGESVWFVGHWGFQYYAERAGWRPVIPDESRLRAGDWLVVPTPVHRQEIRLSASDAVEVATLSDDGGPPLTTGRGYYAGSRPLAHLEGPRLETRIYRLRNDVVPQTSWSAARLAAFAASALPRTAAGAVSALVRALRSEDPSDRGAAARGLAAVGPAAAAAVTPLAAALRDPVSEVRYRAAVALGSIGPAAAPAAEALRKAQEDDDEAVGRAATEALVRIEP